MKRSQMERMTEAELDAYATVLGIDVSKCKTVDAKADEIEARRGRTVDVDVFGETWAVQPKRLHDKRLSDIFGKRKRTDADIERAIRLILGDEQYQRAIDVCTDDDGTVDSEAISTLFVSITANPDVKNF